MEWDTVYPNECLEAEYDIEQAIIHRLQQLNKGWTLEHVKTILRPSSDTSTTSVVIYFVYLYTILVPMLLLLLLLLFNS